MNRPDPRRIDSWKSAELNAAEWMRSWGLTDARVTADGTDGGVDVESASALAQVKFEASQVGRPALQRLVGARANDHHKALLFFSGAGFARTAVIYAEVVSMALFEYELHGTMVPVSSAAVALMNPQPAADKAPGRDERSDRFHRGVDEQLPRDARTGTQPSPPHFARHEGGGDVTPSPRQRLLAELESPSREVQDALMQADIRELVQAGDGKSASRLYAERFGVTRRKAAQVIRAADAILAAQERLRRRWRP